MCVCLFTLNLIPLLQETRIMEYDIHTAILESMCSYVNKFYESFRTRRHPDLKTRVPIPEHIKEVLREVAGRGIYVKTYFQLEHLFKREDRVEVLKRAQNIHFNMNFAFNSSPKNFLESIGTFVVIATELKAMGFKNAVDVVVENLCDTYLATHTWKPVFRGLNARIFNLYPVTD